MSYQETGAAWNYRRSAPVDEKIEIEVCIAPDGANRYLLQADETSPAVSVHRTAFKILKRKDGYATIKISERLAIERDLV